MKKFVFTSLRRDAGKTGIMAGLGKVWSKPLGYCKPFGDRLIYRDKRLWDYDSAVFTDLFDTGVSPERLSLGFDHSKLRYLCREGADFTEKLAEIVSLAGEGKEILLVESGNNINFGMSVHLDAISMARAVGGTLIVVTHGNHDKIMDDLTFLQKNVDLEGVDFGGVILNRIRDIEKFNSLYSEKLKALQLNILGVIPYRKELSRPTTGFISEILSAKILSGAGALHRTIQEIFVGAMSADAVMRMRQFQIKDKIVITSGDRSDMILAAIDTDCVGVVLTNNILPPPNIIARAAGKNIPLLLAQGDTYRIAKKIDQSVPLLSAADTDKIDLWTELVRENVSWDKMGI
ncbi:MAG: AAA family ATPase [FCB group bacterium]|nr:AAA family ATPase [FCB group bacterium]